ncbi:Antilisterial bacteriocin subtilosin biosynthesis protein AlbA [Pseudoruegeria aquimaris]|uniref:Antilisterial bacteriocin subtilosin biosynthesis protein AlbA n=1 Tax=Pseudoruegeria aquimaris TaxID=393663 RepID=A0A1Y5RB66_9RHOB|nr:radical SAM protein [Pseudoruegeria aquimaris]SLN10823.1 Antilisterial bacteriocin subtilosin biosynthesis protein AlbA [Pseudoruegeria aquimaris]
MKDTALPPANAGKFQDPLRTAKGEERAIVRLSDPQTLWFNTGTLCNIACVNCYIESSPSNDALVYLTADEVSDYLDQLETRRWGVREIAFTGGEPFMNPEMCEMMARSLARGYEVLVLTNAMRPMMRRTVREKLAPLIADHRDRITFRVSLDHWSQEQHDAIRGKGSFEKTMEGMGWLRDQGARLAVAGRMLWQESEAEARAAFGRLFAAHGFDIDPGDPSRTVLFPEMDVNVEVPEITTACWDILNKKPSDVMCASSRMVVKHRGAETPSVIACTLLPYAPEFDLGTSLEEAEKPVRLNHPHCAKFCVLGGASCSA